MTRVARLLALVGPVVVVLGLSKIHARYVADPPYDFTGSFRFAWAVGYTVVLLLVTYGFGLPDVPRTPRQALTMTVLASLTAAVVVSAAQLVVGSALMPRFVVFGSALVLLPWQFGLTVVSRSGREREEGRDRVFLVAAPTESARLADDLRISPERNAVMAASLTPDEARGDGESSWPLVDQVRASGATLIVIDRLAQADDRVINQAAELHEGGIRVRTLLQFYEDWLGKLPLSELERASLFFDIGELHRARYGRLKRLLDIVLAVVGIVPLLLSVPFVLIGNLFGNRGRLIYHQPRIGRGGSQFEILKFRTMRPTAPGMLANEWTKANDPRITPFGRFMRTTHLDELPQVVNILRGDLAVVGPRPEQPHYVEELSGKLAFYDLRHLVRPGLTGWAQVKYGYAGHESDALEKLQYEFFYLRRQDMSFDLRILGRTVRSVLGGQGEGPMTDAVRDEVPTDPAAAEAGATADPVRVPVASIVVPMLNELGFIEACLDGFGAQTHPLDRLEVLVVDGGSSDGSRPYVEARMADAPWIRIVENPDRRASSAFNRGIEAATGDYVYLFSSHGVPDPEFVARSVAVLEETGAAGVGGDYRHEGLDPVSNAVGLAMVSPFGMASPHRFAHHRRDVDTISHPGYRIDAVRSIDPFDETLERNSDYEFNWRLRQAGHRLVFDPTVGSVYRPRGSLKALSRQFWHYGRWKVRVIRRHKGSFRARHLVAPAAVVGLAASPLIALHPGGRRLLAAGAAAYLVGTTAAVVTAHPRRHGADPRVLFVCFPVMHASWGAGFLASLIEDTVKGSAHD